MNISSDIISSQINNLIKDEIEKKLKEQCNDILNGNVPESNICQKNSPEYIANKELHNNFVEKMSHPPHLTDKNDSSNSNLKHTLKYNLSLSGGGNFGFAHIGALLEFEKYPELFNFNNISAVSCGSIVGALYSVGYTASELRDIFYNLDLDALITDSFWWKRLLSRYGMYNANKFEEEIERLIESKTSIKLCTFSQIKKNLTIVATNLNYQKAVFFNRDTTPDLVISKAVRMSIAYPVIITPVFYEGDYYNDGGASLNYPISIFDNDLDHTIGIAFIASNENSDGTLKERIEINGFISYLVGIATTMNRATYISQLLPIYENKTIKVPIPNNITSTQFSINTDQKKMIFEAGQNATKEYIKLNHLIDPKLVISELVISEPIDS